MSSWWSRLRGARSATTQTPDLGSLPGSMPATAATIAGASAGPASATAATGAAPVPQFGARRPLVGATGELAGFEFRLPEAAQRRLQARQDGPAAAAHAIALLAAMRPALAAGRAALVELPAAVLSRPALADVVPEGAWLAVNGQFEPDASLGRTFIEWRKRSVRLGAADGRTELPGASFVLLRPGERGLQDVLDACAHWQHQQPTWMRVAVDLDGVESIERALAHGAMLAAGDFATADPGARGQRAIQPGAQRVCRLLNDVVLDRDTAQIGAELRADLALSYRLLRYVNSPAVGLSRPVESVEQAVMVLGRNELYRWLSVLLLSLGSGRRTSRALQEVALARARLLELLALSKQGSPAQEGSPPPALFTVGLLSMLDTLLQVPLADALQPLHLAEPAQDALLARSGPWRPYLELAIHLERHDLAAAEPLAAAHGGLEAVIAMADQAWNWSAEIARSGAAPAPAPSA